MCGTQRNGSTGLQGNEYLTCISQLFSIVVFQFSPHWCLLSAVMQTRLLSADTLLNTRCVSIETGYTKQDKKQLFLHVLVSLRRRYDTIVQCTVKLLKLKFRYIKMLYWIQMAGAAAPVAAPMDRDLCSRALLFLLPSEALPLPFSPALGSTFLHSCLCESQCLLTQPHPLTLWTFGSSSDLTFTRV